MVEKFHQISKNPSISFMVNSFILIQQFNKQRRKITPCFLCRLCIRNQRNSTNRREAEPSRASSAFQFVPLDWLLRGRRLCETFAVCAGTYPTGNLKFYRASPVGIIQQDSCDAIILLGRKSVIWLNHLRRWIFSWKVKLPGAYRDENIFVQK